MKFTSTLIAAFGFTAVANSNLIQRGYDHDDQPTPTYHPPYQPGVTSFPNKFALGAKIGDDIYVAFELDDGQLEYGPKKTNYLPHHPHPHKPWKRDGFDFDNDDSWLTFDSSYGYDWYTLKNSVLRDSKYRIGEIAANHQLQFDLPVQPDALFSSGFSIVHDDGYWLLALNGKTTFWDSPVNDNGIYKIYDAPINPKSKKIELVVIVLV
ncbi:unnamed protein product [Candida parapsilosis]